MTAEPQLSFVLVASSFEQIARTVRDLAAQGDAAQIELVIVTAADGSIDPAREEFAPLAGVRLVEVDSIAPLPVARVPGIRKARAPIVALGETHAFPAPGWSRALLAAHAAGFDVVGPGITNANPATLLSWANLFLDYGRWIEPSERTEMDDLPGHNSSYRRAILTAFTDAELGRLLEAETELHLVLRDRGCRLLLDPAARLGHTNVTRWSSTFLERFAAGQRFAAARGHRFSLGRRLAYAFGSPLIPFVRFPRIVRDIRRTGRGGQLLPRILPTLSFCLLVSAAGELAGYLVGSGSSMHHLSRIELDKRPHLRRGDTLVESGS